MYIFLIILLYFIPSITAYSRKRKNAGSVFVLNFFLGWTFIGWVVALVWAVNKTEDKTVIIKDSQSPSSVNVLERLAQLKEKGIINEAEFEAQKKKILS